MYIRRTKVKGGPRGEVYITHRLVESVRTERGVRQRTLLNLGKDFPVPPERWAELIQHLEQVLSGQSALVPLPGDLESLAQRLAAQLVQAQAQPVAPGAPEADYQAVDLNSLELLRPRTVGVEHVALHAVHELELDTQLAALGLNAREVQAALGMIVARLAGMGSERAGHAYLTQRSGLGELLGCDLGRLSLTRLYQVGDLLRKHQDALAAHLFERERHLFQLEETITLFDLTNTYFEGAGEANDYAAYGHSKEKRSDCPLVTLGRVLDASGFPKKSRVFAGNVSEPATLKEMIQDLHDVAHLAEDLFATVRPVVVLDAGIATEANLEWLRAAGYPYLVVSRKRHREFSEEAAVLVKDTPGAEVKGQRVERPETAEVELYCHSQGREQKERGIQTRFSKRYEEALANLAAGLAKKTGSKQTSKVLERLGRLKERYRRVAHQYEVHTETDASGETVTGLSWERKARADDTALGVYCLRTTLTQWDESRLWHTYVMLTDLAAVFRSLKSALGLRPVFHQKTDRVSAHLFLTVLAYHLVHTLRVKLKAQGIDLSWERLRTLLASQVRVTTTLRLRDGRHVHLRKATQPEPETRAIYRALGLPNLPGRTEKTFVDTFTPAAQVVVP
jgi:transposase